MPNWLLIRAGVFALLLPTCLIAETPLSGADFEAASEGAVFDIRESGRLVQREQFLENRRVRLGFPPEGHDPESLAPVPCIDGSWYPDEEAICFLYELPAGGRDGPHCWSVMDMGEGRQLATSQTSDLTLDMSPSEVPLICLGPEIGV